MAPVEAARVQGAGGAEGPGDLAPALWGLKRACGREGAFQELEVIKIDDNALDYLYNTRKETYAKRQRMAHDLWDVGMSLVAHTLCQSKIWRQIGARGQTGSGWFPRLVYFPGYDSD